MPMLSILDHKVPVSLRCGMCHKEPHPGVPLLCRPLLKAILSRKRQAVS